jgi:HlyD family secretion protein
MVPPSVNETIAYERAWIMTVKRIIIIALLLAVLGGFGGWYMVRADKGTTTFRTVQVERGDLLATISATGTIEPEEVIDIGAQVAGQILSFGKDPRDPDDPDKRFPKDPRYKGKLIDFRSPVETGTVLARIDEALYQAQVDQADAQVAQAKANLESANAQVVVAQANVKAAVANLDQMVAKLNQADRDWTRVQKLGPAKAVADVDYDTAEATYLSAKATVAVGNATIAQTQASLKDAQANVVKAQAALTAAEATLKNAQINLGYCTIKAPVKGVIVDRRVNIGQTVVSSLNAPSLFLLAKDLKRLQVWSSVNEADIDNVKPGQAVTFTVDAHPDRTFKGEVAQDQPRLNASMTQNVVTYTVVVDTDNSDGALLPYLTANLQFEISKRSGVLLVPNAALRWKPTLQQVAPESRDDYAKSQKKNKVAPGEKPAAGTDKEPHNRGVLWVEDKGYVRPIKVRIGLSDGVQTEIVKGDIQEGAAVVVGEGRPTDSAGTTNPFAPKMFGGNKPQQQQ